MGCGSWSGGGGGASCGSLTQSCAHGGDQGFDVRRFFEVIVHLSAKRFQGSLVSGKAGKDEIHTVGLEMTHSCNYKKAVAGPGDVEVDEQDIEVGGVHFGESFANARRGDNAEATFFENQRKCGANALFIVNEENARRSIQEFFPVTSVLSAF
jgi:hypothetical protein